MTRKRPWHEQPRWPAHTPIAAGGHGPGGGRFRPVRPGGIRPRDWAGKLAGRMHGGGGEFSDWWAEDGRSADVAWSRQVLTHLVADHGIDPVDYGDVLYDLPNLHADWVDAPDAADYAAQLADHLQMEDMMQQAQAEELGTQLQAKFGQWSQNPHGTWLKGRGAIYPPGSQFNPTPHRYSLHDSFYVGDIPPIGDYATLQEAQAAYDRYAQFYQDRKATHPNDTVPAILAMFKLREAA